MALFAITLSVNTAHKKGGLITMRYYLAILAVVGLIVFGNVGPNRVLECLSDTSTSDP